MPISILAKGSAASASLPAAPHFPWVPPGADPETYEIDRVNAVLKRAAYFPIFNLPTAGKPGEPALLIPGIHFLITSVSLTETLHRFEMAVTADGSGVLKAANQIGEPVADVHIRWTPMPKNFAADPGVIPPATILNPLRSQRFCMREGSLRFRDAVKTGVRAFGTGRTFPAVENGKRGLRLGAVIDVLQGFGKFQDLPGTMCINGFIRPPHDLALNLVVRMMDPEGRLRAEAPVAPLTPIAAQDPPTVFMMFLGETDPDQPVTLIPAPGGRGFIGSSVHELLRLVHFGFDLDGGNGIRSFTREGPIVGSVSAILYFNMLDPSPVIPIQTTRGVFTFFDRNRKPTGAILANMVEGRAIRQQLPCLPMPLFRFAGFGPILGGSKAFEGADGMMSMNSAVSVFPRTLSNLYVFRFYDPEGRLRERCQQIWQ